MVNDDGSIHFDDMFSWPLGILFNFLGSSLTFEVKILLFKTCLFYLFGIQLAFLSSFA